MRYLNATLRVEDSTNLLLSSRNQNAMRQTLMDSYFGTVNSDAEEDDSNDDDDGTTIGNTDYTNKDAHCTDEE